MENYAVNIRTLREANGMTQADLAQKLGIEAPAVSKWERGLANPKIQNAVKMAEIFGVSIDVVLGLAPVSATA